MNKTKADILYESLANFTDEEGAIECGAKMRDYARELECENTKLLGLLREVYGSTPINQRANNHAFGRGWYNKW